MKAKINSILRREWLTESNPVVSEKAEDSHVLWFDDRKMT